MGHCFELGVNGVFEPAHENSLNKLNLLYKNECVCRNRCVLKWSFCLLTSHPHPPKNRDKTPQNSYYQISHISLPHPIASESFKDFIIKPFITHSRSQKWGCTNEHQRKLNYANREHWISFYSFSAHSSIAVVLQQLPNFGSNNSFISVFANSSQRYTTHTACIHKIQLNFPLKTWFFAK